MAVCIEIVLVKSGDISMRNVKKFPFFRFFLDFEWNKTIRATFECSPVGVPLYPVYVLVGT